MRPFCAIAFLSLPFALLLPAAASTQASCSSSALPEAAKQVIAVRHQLHEQTVGENDPKVPATVATQLGQFKDALANAAQAAFACAPADVSPEDLEKTLATALHANQSSASETVIETKNKRDLGAYGSDLSVQVFPLYSSPRYFEVDFRYGVECGDDNLLLVFETGGAHATAGSPHWQPVLRWGAPTYNTVADAYGDFVLLTPLSGFPGQRNWRFVVAHGQPGCGAATRPSHFDLDLLEPSDDPAHPQVVWHLEREYLRAETPRLSTTEDTLTFELAPPEKNGKTAKAPPMHGDTYRFQVGKDNQVQPLTAAAENTPATTAAHPPKP